MRFRAGSKVEVKVLSPIFMGLSAVGALVALQVIG